jgi:hypothetical protein
MSPADPRPAANGPATDPATARATARGWTTLVFVYLALAVVGLIGTWTWNIRAIAQGENYLGEWIGNTASVSSLTTDLLVVVLAGSIFIIVEARRLGMRAGWAYVVGGLLIAFAFTFPLFLAMRQRRLVLTRAAEAGAPTSTGT